MPPLPTPDDATSSGTFAAANENLAQSTSVDRHATDKSLPAEAAQPSPIAEGNASSGDSATVKQAPQASSNDKAAALPASTTQPSSNDPKSDVSNLKTSPFLPFGGSSESEDMLDLFSPPPSTNARKNPRAMTVVTAADPVLRDREDVVLPFGQGLAPHQTGSVTRTPRSETYRQKSPHTTSLDIQFDSSGEDFDAALQLTFDESPETSRARSSPLSSPPKDSDIPQQFQPPHQKQQIKQQKQERTLAKQKQQQPPAPQQPGAPVAPAAGQMQRPYPYPVFYPHPYGGQVVPPGSNQVPPGAYGYPGQMMPGVVPMPGYGYPPWGSPAGQYYGYPPMAVPQQYPMHPPATPASKTPSATPSKKMSTPGKRKERRNDANLTVETAELSFDEMATPMSPPSSKKKRDGLGIGSWPSPPHDYMKSDLGSSITPQRGSTTASRSRRGETPSHTPRLSSFDENFSFGATPAREILQAPSWSPGAMGAFFEDEGMLHGDTGEPASLESWEMKPSFGEVGNTQDQRQYMSATHPSRSYMSEASPSRGGITIRGSPITSNAVRSVDRPEFPLTTPSSKKAAGKPQYPGQASWQTPSNCGVRIRIGSAGMEKSKAKNNVDDINSVLRGSPVSTAPTGFPHPTALRATPAQNSMYPGFIGPTGNAGMTTPAATRRGGVGKENTENDRVTNPCNCKKSKCLKLYCECFASENYCCGCKCSNCQNTPQYQDIRDKAIADTKAKNPVAFKAKIDTTETEHATGCKCKKSACLKKYCECFEGGVVCGENCKCSGCQNFAGSQTLADRRKKMNDSSKSRLEANTVVKAAQKAWSDSKLSRFGQSPIIHDPNRPIMGSPMHHPFMASQPPYQPHPVMLGQSPIVYPHGMMYPPYSAPRSDPFSSAARTDHPGMQVPIYPHYPIDSTPKTAGTVRRGFDPHGSAKKPARKMESKDPYFGQNVPEQTRTTALNIFSYLANDDLFNASIVSKTWSDLAFDNELWQPASGEIRL